MNDQSASLWHHNISAQHTTDQFRWCQHYAQIVSVTSFSVNHVECIQGNLTWMWWILPISHRERIRRVILPLPLPQPGFHPELNLVVAVVRGGGTDKGPVQCRTQHKELIQWCNKKWTKSDSFLVGSNIKETAEQYTCPNISGIGTWIIH